MKHHSAHASFAHVVLLTMAALLVTAHSALAQRGSALEGLEIRKIELDVPPAADLARFRETIRTHEGDAYDSRAIQDDISALYKLGGFADVRADTEPLDGGLRLIFRLRRIPKIREIRFHGNIVLSEKKLRELLQTRVGRPASPYLLKADVKTLRDHYHKRGYRFAEIRQETRSHDDGVALLFHIEAGAKLRVEAVQFEGNDAVSDRELRKVMLWTKAWSLLDRVGKFDPLLLSDDLAAAREVVRGKGYLDATVGHELLFDDAKQRLYIIVHIDQGPLYRLKQIEFQGTNVLQPDELRAVTKLQEGEPFSRNQLEQDLEALKALYGRNGYAKARIRAERMFSEDEPVLTLRFAVEEGPLCYVNKVMIRGNWRTKDHVIRRDVSLLPGDILNTDEIEKSERRLTNTGLFFQRDPELAFDTPVKIFTFDTEFENRRDVIVEVTEGGAGAVMLGAGWNSNIGLVGNISLTLRNFDALDYPTSWREFANGLAWTGGGQKLTLSLSPGLDYNDYRLGWFNPSVYDSPYATGFTLYLTDFSWAQYYDEGRRGVSFTVGRRFSDELSVALTPTLEDVDISNLATSAPPAAFAARGSHDRRTLALSVAYDKRDNFLMPTTGYKLAASTEMGGTLLGGDVDFMHERFEARRWWTVWNQPDRGKHVVTCGGEIGLLQSTGSGSVPIFDRLFIGGIGSLRGFQSRRVGPVDPTVLRQIGGEYMALFNVEYSAPLYNDYLRAVTFLDTGTLTRSASDLSMNNVRAAMGFGFLIKPPQFQIPIGLYFAMPLKKKGHDKREAISFNIGTAFEF